MEKTSAMDRGRREKKGGKGNGKLKGIERGMKGVREGKKGDGKMEKGKEGEESEG